MRDSDIDIENFFTSLFRFFYRRRAPGPLELKKPRFKWMPKYVLRVRLPASIVTAEAPSDELEQALKPLGFQLSHWTREKVFFARGKSWGDFSIKCIRVMVSFPTPLAPECDMLVEVADVCLFDTGDLWRLCHEIRAQLAGTSQPGK